MPAAKASGATVRHPAIISDSGQVGNATWQSNERTTDANARLIAAAPELLEALRIAAQSLAWISHGKCRGFHDGLEQPSDALVIAAAAIAKATGEAK
jgi:hypothetical protein